MTDGGCRQHQQISKMLEVDQKDVSKDVKQTGQVYLPNTYNFIENLIGMQAQKRNMKKRGYD